jgi:excisionase family DNA binding protein
VWGWDNAGKRLTSCATVPNVTVTDTEAQQVADTLDSRITLTVAEVAEATGLAQRTVRRHINAGRLKSKLVGGRRLVKVDDLRRFIDQQ